MYFGHTVSSVRAPTQQELKIAERIVAYNTGIMDEVARINEREEDLRRWKAYL